MKSLYESIISNTRIGNKAKFADDLEYQRCEILRIVKEHFSDIKVRINYKRGDDYQFSCVAEGDEAFENIHLIETALRKYDYFENINLNAGRNDITITAVPPITKENLFPSVYIKFIKHITAFDDIFDVDISITDNRDWDFDWVKAYKKL